MPAEPFHHRRIDQILQMTLNDLATHYFDACQWQAESEDWRTREFRTCYVQMVWGIGNWLGYDSPTARRWQQLLHHLDWPAGPSWQFNHKVAASTKTDPGFDQGPTP